ncbi:MAG: S8 family serine peptidase [Steroidobacteraceae bacterium]|nr:S8 family serine peptidase [Steroidobacteraceae bacterium]
MKSKRVGHGHVKWAVCSALLTASTLAAAAPRDLDSAGIARLTSLSLPQAIESTEVGALTLHPTLAKATGRQEILVRLRTPSVARGGGSVTREQILIEQADFISRALEAAPASEVIGSVQLVLNAVFLDVDAADLPEIARDLSVTRIVGTGNYSHDLSETVPYIGAATAQSLGARGDGVRVAVIDSGIDYTHRNLGGPGTRAAYEAAWAPIPVAPAPAVPVVAAGTGYLVVDDPGTTADDGLFPSAKVIGGWDFVGESWPNAPLAPDPDPIPAPDATTFGGHGTHVADIIGGTGGVAPGVKFYAYKVCSAPTSSCSGIALIQAMDYAVDPNRDGNPADHVDLINMSLGSVYGQPFDDDLSAAVDAATALGVMTVASAGNSADKQFITGSPGGASSALSVAQTEVPSAALATWEIVSPALGTRGAVFQPWSAPLAATIEGAVFYPNSTLQKAQGCLDAAGTNPYAAGELAGRIVLIDRGNCSFSLKVANAAAAGATLVILGVITPDPPFAAAFGGGAQPVPAYMVSLADSNAIRGGATVRFSLTGTVSVAGSLASTSSRGPRFDDSIVKPEIGAPGASVSAMSGSFTGAAAFGGTSGAAPMVTGAAAILKGARPELSIGDIKQILINTADPNVRQPSANGSVFPDQVAPITRIGGGEVRVDRALLSPAFVSDVTGDAVSAIRGAMSFGFVEADLGKYAFTRRLRVTNTSGKALSYRVTPTYRYQDDVDTGAVGITAQPASISVAANSTATVDVVLTVRSTKLRNNLMNAGSLGQAIGPLTANEHDGYIVFQASDHRLTMPWHILPRKASNVQVRGGVTALKFDALTGAASFKVSNTGVGTAQLAAYSLLGTSPDAPQGGRGGERPNPDLRAVGVSAFAVPAGPLCGSAVPTFVWEFAFNMWDRDANPAGQFLEVDLDVNRDGIDDFVLVNRDNSGNTTLTDGRQVAALWRLNPAGTTIVATTIRFFAENSTNTANTVLRVCGNDLGIPLAEAGVRLVDASFWSSSWYFGGPADSLGRLFTITPGGEEFSAAVPATIAPSADATIAAQQWGLVPGTTPHEGLLILTNAPSATNTGGATQASEALILPRAP